MPCFCLTPKQYDFNKIPELQVCIAEALYDVDSIVAFSKSSYPLASLAPTYRRVSWSVLALSTGHTGSGVISNHSENRSR